MGADLYIFNVIAALVYLAVGVRLFALSRRTRGRPEYLLALNYLCTGVSYCLYELPTLFEHNPTWTLITARIIYSVGIVPLLLFTRDVFRTGSRWANGLVWTNALVLFCGVFFSTLNGDIEGLIVSSVWFWCDWIGYTAPYIWISAEALIAYSAARKRQRVGLCKPETSNRFLLWAFFGIFATLAGIALIPLYLEYAATQVWPRWGDFTSGGLEAAATVVLWFVFFPPAFYRRWVNRAAATPSNAAN
jgi:hypothetical protein